MPAVVAPAKKKSPILFILGTLAVLFLLLIVAGVGGVMMMRKRHEAARAAVVDQKRKEEATKVAEASAIRNQLEQKQADLAAAQQKLATTSAPGATGTQTTTAPAGSQAADLQRQLQESQQQIENLARQLQEKNDEVSSAREAANHVQTRTVYVPAPAPARPRPELTSANPGTLPHPATPGNRPVQGTTGQQQRPTAAAPASQVAAAAQETPLPALNTGKRLKKKIFINPLPPEVAPANLPGDTARTLANLIGTALVATGDYAVESHGVASINVAVTNYVSTKRSNLNVKTAADSANRIGAIFGKSVPTTPVNVPPPRTTPPCPPGSGLRQNRAHDGRVRASLLGP